MLAFNNSLQTCSNTTLNVVNTENLLNVNKNTKYEDYFSDMHSGLDEFSVILVV